MSTELAVDERQARVAAIIDTPFNSPDLSALRSAVSPPPAKRPRGSAFRSPWRFAPRWYDKIRPVAGIDHKRNNVLLKECDGKKNIREIARLIDVPEDRLLALVGDNLGRLFVLDEAQRLEAEVCHLELSRWPLSPYEVDRNYWRNNVAVRKELDGLPQALATPATFLRFLRVLHVTYIMGADLETFYFPKSETRRSLGSSSNGPGQLRSSSVHCPMEDELEIGMFRLLARALHDASAKSENQPITDSEGLLLGEIYWRWVSGGARVHQRHVFATIESLLPEHIQKLWQSLVAVHGALLERSDTHLIKALAQFFRRFICLHPFPCGNMGLVMNIVNWCLHRRYNGYICHLHLDWCAHRLEEAPFGIVFERAIDRYLLVEADGNRRDEVMARFSAAHDALRVIAEWRARSPHRPADLSADQRWLLLLA